MKRPLNDDVKVPLHSASLVLSRQFFSTISNHSVQKSSND